MQGSFKKKKKISSDMALQITSMADIFTLILVFLLKSSASGESTVSPSTSVTLPEGKGKDIPREVLKIEITQTDFMVDQKYVVRLNNFEFPLGEVLENGVSRAVMASLNDQRKLHSDARGSSELLVLADARTPYSTLKVAMASAANTGFVDLQLVVVEAE